MQVRPLHKISVYRDWRLAVAAAFNLPVILGLSASPAEKRARRVLTNQGKRHALYWLLSK